MRHGLNNMQRRIDMIIPDMWSYITDNNNYINRKGRLTSICPKCKNLYTVDLQLDMTCEMEEFQEGYRLKENPEIVKVCDCSENGIITSRVDNLMGTIVKTLLEKGYHVRFDRTCEGHVYQKGTEVLCKTHPVIYIMENLLLHPDYPNKNKDVVAVGCYNGSTIMPAKHCLVDKFTVEQYERIKPLWLRSIEEYVNDMPLAVEVRHNAPDKDKIPGLFCKECGMIV